MDILGIACFYHDSAAALVRDGILIAAAEEERFSRKKHDSGFPSGAVAYCLEEAGKTIDEIDHIIFYEKPLPKFIRIIKSYLATWPMSRGAFVRAMPVWLKEKLWIESIIQKELKTKKPLLFCEHHLSHAASTFLPSPFEEAAILTIDGVGEWETTTLGTGRGIDIELMKKIDFPHSLGLFYSTITAYLGFRVNDAEWKVMGLAPYGEPKYADRLRQIIDVRQDGSFRLDMSYFAHARSAKRMYSGKFASLLGQPPRVPESEITDFHRDVAASGQLVLEEVILKIARHLHDITGLSNLCVAGGVGLNSVANWKILERTPFDKVFVQPAAGDSGGAAGAALYLANSVLGVPKRYTMQNVYLGPSFSDDEIEEFLKSTGARFEKLNRNELIKKTASAIADDLVVGWFQGRMEFGPRALGHRSILANPANPRMKDIINSKVKFREKFRPFAPSVLKEFAYEYFDIEEGAEFPFMLMTPDIRPEKRSVIPAVTHHNGTGRLQTVTRDQNGLYYDLIEQFRELTGIPVLLNTSFNVRGDAIVCTPRDAYETYRKSGIDVVIMGPFFLKKE